VLIVGLLACADVAGESGAAGDAPEPLEVMVSQGNDTPARRVRWSTPEPSVGVVEFGEGGAGLVVEDPTEGTEHEVVVVGAPAGRAWQLRVLATAGDRRWASTVVDVAADPAPGDIPVPLASGKNTGAAGFLVAPVRGDDAARVAAWNASGELVWWSPSFLPHVYRSRYEADGQRMSWMEFDAGAGTQALVRATLDGDEERVDVPALAHQDFVRLPGGDTLALVLDARVENGTRVHGETLVRIDPNGATRTVWSSWDRWTWDGSGKVSENGDVEWPHANGLSVDTTGQYAFVSLFYADAIVKIALANGHEEWVLGGSHTELTIDGEGFASPHSPVVSADGRQLWLMDNGEAPASDAAEARGYDLDESARRATARWVYSDGDAHTGVVFGDVIPVEGGDVVVNWGTAGVAQRVTENGDERWRLEFPLGTFPMLCEFWEGFGGAAE
jgi:hypothetical protein